jgi:GT2 family glycosyltransferase
VLYHRAGRLVRGQPEHAETGRDRAAARRAACHALERRGCDAVVSSARTPGTLRVSFRPRRSERVAIIISTRDQARLLSACVRSILRCTRYPSYEIVIVNNGSTEPESLEQLRRWSSDPRIRILNAPGPFNYSALNNLAALFTRAPLLALLNNDTEVISPRWLCEMVGVLEQDGVGAVGPKLLYGDGTIQHAGIVLGIGGVASHAHKRFPRDHGGYHGLLESVRDVSAVTGACLLTRRGLYLELGGLDEALAVAYNDTDYCLRLRARGYRVLFTPLAELYHHESASRGVDRRGAARFEAELALMRCRWGELLRRDPFYNPNLSLDRTNYQPVGDEEDRQGHSGASLRRAG